MTAREEAIADCKYALSLGKNTLNAHIGIWLIPFNDECENTDEYDTNYQLVIQEIKEKLETDQCLLK